MPDIGASLREARMRARIDVSEVEARTKIRAKYLRALENEEWDLLPGPTYVKSFLRTYAEMLDLDAKLLVDEYKLRHEHLSDVELQPISAAAPGLERRRRPAPALPPWVFVAVIVAGLVFALYLLGTATGDDPPEQPAAPSPPPVAATNTAPVTTPAAVPERPEPRLVRLRIEATGLVNVCLKAGDRTLVDGRTLSEGERTGTFRSRRFRLTLGNNGVRLRINDRLLNVEASPNPIGLEITPDRGRQPLSADERPVCR
ncbi:MAG: helix-turn-helix domain-containing protein [Solirubrobacteraceae bacterium]|nr:helix-turn-helix domain-containing protein [Solirubrobacteraceae bacterium]